jgi:hypothetical protein
MPITRSGIIPMANPLIVMATPAESMKRDRICLGVIILLIVVEWGGGVSSFLLKIWF